MDLSADQNRCWRPNVKVEVEEDWSVDTISEHPMAALTENQIELPKELKAAGEHDGSFVWFLGSKSHN
jgi:hypothetical protein